MTDPWQHQQSRKNQARSSNQFDIEQHYFGIFQLQMTLEKKFQEVETPSDQQ